MRFRSSITPKPEDINAAAKCAQKIASMANDTPYWQTIKPVDIANINNTVKDAALFLKQFDHLIIIGMGGAVNNPKVVLTALEAKAHYLNTTDPQVLQKLLTQIKLENTAVLVTSNSGRTTENIHLYNALLKLDADIAKRSVFLVGQGDNYLCSLAHAHSIRQIAYNIDLGGRFSGFSEVNALPLMACGLDATKFLEGSNNIAARFAAQDIELLHNLAILITHDKQNTVLLSYSNALLAFNEWYSQIVGESLGKNSKGLFPITGIGPQDQHSMLQLYLDGPDDCFFTFIKVAASVDYPSEGNFTLQQVHDALAEATIAALVEQKRPLLVIEIPEISLYHLGELMMFMSLYVVCKGMHSHINPFDQPAVELIKKKTKQLLAI